MGPKLTALVHNFFNLPFGEFNIGFVPSTEMVGGMSELEEKKAGDYAYTLRVDHNLSNGVTNYNAQRLANYDRGES